MRSIGKIFQRIVEFNDKGHFALGALDVPIASIVFDRESNFGVMVRMTAMRAVSGMLDS